MKSLLLSSKVPAIPQLHQCSQCNYLPSSVEKLFVQNTDKQQEDLGYYLTIIALYHHIVQLLASICPEHCLSRTLSRRLMLQNGDHRVPPAAGLGRLSAGAKMAMKPFVKRVFTIFATNASFLRIISNFRI